MFTNDFVNNDIYYQVKTVKDDFFFNSHSLDKQKVNKNYNYESHKYDYSFDNEQEGRGLNTSNLHHYSNAVNLLRNDRPKSDYIKSEFYNKYLKPNTTTYYENQMYVDNINKIRPDNFKELDDDFKKPEVKVLENTEKPEVKKIIDKRRKDPAKRLKMKLNNIRHKKVNNAAFRKFINNL